ncbi:hypothetical protein GCM10020220_017070 [Nonomuraea rubra]
MSDLTGRVRGPLAPSTAVERPLSIDDVEIHGGPLGRWQQINREASIPLGLEQMEKSGAAPNLRLAAGEAGGAFQGYRFQDSDLYKQLEAVAWEHSRHPDDAYRSFVAGSAALLARAQRPDGYLNSHYQVVKPDRIFAELEYSHEMYCAGHLFQAAVAAARAGLGEELLGVARRFADLLVRRFLVDGDDGIDGHAEVETALVELYRLTGERPYLELARKLIDNRGKGLIKSTGMGPALRPGPPARTRGRHRRRPRRAPALPGGGRRGRRRRDRRRRPARLLRTPLGGPGRHQDLHHRRARLPPRRRGVRRAVRAAPRPRLQRELRGHREHPLELAAAAGHRARPLRRPDRAHPLQRLRRLHQRRRHPLLLRQPAAAPRRPVRGRLPGQAAGVVRLRVLPAEHHAAGLLARPLRRHRRRRERVGAPVRAGG